MLRLGVCSPAALSGKFRRSKLQVGVNVAAVAQAISSGESAVLFFWSQY